MDKKRTKNHEYKGKKLHLGCGFKKYPGALGVDINPKSGADIIDDLNKFPYPFKTSQFVSVYAEHILEHLDNIPKVMSEIYRITKSGGRLFITSPHFSSMDSFTDPTHLHSFTTMSFDYFIPGTDLYNLRYSSLKYNKKSVTIGDVNTPNLLLKIILYVINKNLLFYEKRFAFLFPVGIIQFGLEVIK